MSLFLKIVFILANSANSDEMPPYAAFHLGIHCLPKYLFTTTFLPVSRMKMRGPVAQLVTCLATDTCLTADPGVASLIPARNHTFVEMGHEIISTVILLPFADSFSVTSESMCTNYLLTACSSLPRKKVWLGELTVPP